MTIRTTYGGNTKGPAKVVMKDTAFMIPAPVRPQTDYRIDVELPREKTVESSSRPSRRRMRNWPVVVPHCDHA